MSSGGTGILPSPPGQRGSDLTSPRERVHPNQRQTNRNQITVVEPNSSAQGVIQKGPTRTPDTKTPLNVFLRAGTIKQSLLQSVLLTRRAPEFPFLPSVCYAYLRIVCECLVCAFLLWLFDCVVKGKLFRYSHLFFLLSQLVCIWLSCLRSTELPLCERYRVPYFCKYCSPRWGLLPLPHLVRSSKAGWNTNRQLLQQCISNGRPPPPPPPCCLVLFGSASNFFFDYSTVSSVDCPGGLSFHRRSHYDNNFLNFLRVCDMSWGKGSVTVLFSASSATIFFEDFNQHKNRDFRVIPACSGHKSAELFADSRHCRRTKFHKINPNTFRTALQSLTNRNSLK